MAHAVDARETRGTDEWWRTPPAKVFFGVGATVVWGLFFGDLARTGHWLLDTTYFNIYPLADLHSRYVDAHLIWKHAANLYKFRRGALTYPPFAAYLFLPFHLIGYGATMTVWTIGSVASLAGILAVAVRRWLHVPPADAWLISAAALAPAAIFIFYPLHSLLVWGQMGTYLTAIVVLDLFVVPRRYRGVLIGVATAIKLLPVLFIIWFLARREVAPVVRVVVTFLTVTLIAAAVYPHASVQFWFHVLPSGRDVRMASDPFNLPVSTTRWIYGVGKLPNQSLRGLLGRPPFFWFGDLPWAILAVGVLAVGIFVVLRFLRQGRELAAFLMLSVTTVLVSPVSWLHYWLFVALVPILVIVEWRRDRALAVAAMVMAVATCVNLEDNSNFLWSAQSTTAPIVLFVVRNIYVLGGMVFFTTAAIGALRSSDAAVPEALLA